MHYSTVIGLHDTVLVPIQRNSVFTAAEHVHEQNKDNAHSENNRIRKRALRASVLSCHWLNVRHFTEY